MKTASMSALPVDPGRWQNAGIGSVAITQASAGKEHNVSLPHKVLQKDSRLSEEIQKILDEMNTQLNIMNRSIQFSIDESSHDIVVRVVDKDTGEVIREVPPESIQKLREKMAELTGLLVEEEV